MYITTDEVYGAAGITSSEVSEANVNNFILEAEERLDRFTNTTYWKVEVSGTASSATNNTLTTSGAGWDADVYIDEYLWIYKGTGSGQSRLITDNTTEMITVDSDWSTNPDNTSKYRVIHTGKNPYNEEVIDGSGTDIMYTAQQPLRILESLTIDSTSVTTSKVYTYDTGKLILKKNAETTFFSDSNPQQVSIDYWHGVYPFPLEAKRLCTLYAAISTLESQMGGTHNIPSTYSLPEGSLTIGQAYINIEGTVRRLIDEKSLLEQKIIVYTSFS